MKALCLPALLFCAAFFTNAHAQRTQTAWNTPSAGNPILPGYFADPTIRKFGDTYYIYATTDGTGNGYGPAQAWVSKDFVNWQNVLLNWPTTEVVWAPDVVQAEDGTYRYYYCTPCEVRVGESCSPLGPWKNRLGASDAVLVPDRFVHNAITLDPALFRDDDGSEYLYFGTWGIYKDFGCGVARLAADGKTFTDKKLIPNTEITDFFEAPFVFKKDGVYYFTYSSGSCHDDTYRVQYAVSTAGPMGPYTYKGCILRTNADGTIHGPGHHSILVDGNDYYIVYHRHNNPHAIHGFHRQICIDKLDFDANGNILPVVPTHDGVIPASLQKQAKKHALPNLAYGASVTASSTYGEWFKPEYAVDDNNGTLWRAADASSPASITIDLGRQTAFNEVFTQFEYATFFYQYKMETSPDASHWTLFADRTGNTRQGSPMIDKGKAKARYIRITITDTQKNGHFPAIWNVKVYNATKRLDPAALLPSPETDEESIVEGYPWIHKKDIEPQQRTPSATDRGMEATPIFTLNAKDYRFGSTLQGVPVVPKDGKAAFRFDGQSTITLPWTDQQHAASLTYNAPYTVTAWILNPEAGGLETVAQFMPVGNDLATIELRNGKNAAEGIVAHNASFENAGAPQALQEGQWQHWAVSFDGFNERIYCNGTLVSEKNIFLMLRPGRDITVGSAWNGSNPFSGFLHSLDVYDRPFTAEDVAADMAKPTSLDQEELKRQAAQSPLANARLHLATRQLSPQLFEVSVVTADGKPLPAGICDYSFAVEGHGAAVSGTPVALVSAMQAQARITVQVSDVYGNAAPALEGTLDADAGSYADLALPIMEKAVGGQLTLESEGTNLNSSTSLSGPIKAVDIEGDFVLVCRVSDMTGMAARNTPAYNEGGLLLQQLSDNGEQQRLVQLGVFPNYNCGNMLTLVDGNHRPQSPNNKGWNFDPWLMILREGSVIQFLTSADGVLWKPMPSGADYNPFGKAALRAGVYQTTYSAAHAGVSFTDIHLWQKKQ